MDSCTALMLSRFSYQAFGPIKYFNAWYLQLRTFNDKIPSFFFGDLMSSNSCSLIPLDFTPEFFSLSALGKSTNDSVEKGFRYIVVKTYLVKSIYNPSRIKYGS